MLSQLLTLTFRCLVAHQYWCVERSVPAHRLWATFLIFLSKSRAASTPQKMAALAASGSAWPPRGCGLGRGRAEIPQPPAAPLTPPLRADPTPTPPRTARGDRGRPSRPPPALPRRQGALRPPSARLRGGAGSGGARGRAGRPPPPPRLAPARPCRGAGVRAPAAPPCAAGPAAAPLRSAPPRTTSSSGAPGALRAWGGAARAGDDAAEGAAAARGLGGGAGLRREGVLHRPRQPHHQLGRPPRQVGLRGSAPGGGGCPAPRPRGAACGPPGGSPGAAGCGGRCPGLGGVIGGCGLLAAPRRAGFPAALCGAASRLRAGRSRREEARRWLSPAAGSAPLPAPSSLPRPGAPQAAGCRSRCRPGHTAERWKCQAEPPAPCG